MTVYWLPVVAVVLRGTEFRVAVEATAAAAAVDTMVAVAERQRKTTDQDGLQVVVVAHPFLEE
jgi:hypothetical protein